MAWSADQDQTQILFCVICMVLMPIYFVQAQNYKCELKFDGKCIIEVSWKIEEKYAEKQKPFTIAYNTTEGKNGIAVVLHYVGYYLCEAAEEHICDEGNKSTSLNRNITDCVTDRTYTIAADGEDAISCTPAQNETEPSGSNPDNDKHNATREGTPQYNDVIIGISSSCALLVLLVIVVFACICWPRYRKIIENDKSDATDQEGKEETEKETFLAVNG